MVGICLTPLDHNTDDLANPLLCALIQQWAVTAACEAQGCCTCVTQRVLVKHLIHSCYPSLCMQNSLLEYALHSGVQTGKNCS